MTPVSDEDIRALARARIGWKTHALAYALVNLAVAITWWFSNATAYWPAWMHLGWGAGLAAHGVGVYGGPAGWTAREEARLRARFNR